MATPNDRGQKGAGVAAPFLRGGVIAICNQPARQLIDIEASLDFGKQIPFYGSGFERIENDVATVPIIEMVQISRVGIGKYRPIAARNRRAQQFPNRRGLAGAGAADQLKMLGLIARRDRHARERE